MESMMEEQRNQIDELQLRLTALISQRRRVKTPKIHYLRVPGLSSSRCAPPSPEGYSPLPPLDSPTPRQHSREREEHQRERVNTSLPRLAPLHTQMNLVNRSAHSSGECCLQCRISVPLSVALCSLLPQNAQEDEGEMKISLSSPLFELTLPPYPPPSPLSPHPSLTLPPHPPSSPSHLTLPPHPPSSLLIILCLLAC